MRLGRDDRQLEGVPWRDFSQAGISREHQCSGASPVGEIIFDRRLKTPGDAPEQMFAVTAWRGLLKQLTELGGQIGQRRPAQTLNFHQNGSFHSWFPLGVGLTTDP